MSNPTNTSTGKGSMSSKRAADGQGHAGGSAAKRKRCSNAELTERRTVSLNNQITQHARRKELGEALRIFEEACNSGIANMFTFSITMNAFVRCNDIEGARQVFIRMKEWGIAPSVVTYSTYLKGLCSSGDMQEATALLEEMEKSKVPPNIRSINTYLRGCLMHGTVNEAVECYSCMEKRWGVPPDENTLEYMVQMLSQALRLEEACAVVKRMEQTDPSVAPFTVARAQLFVARAAVLLGDRCIAEQAISQSQSMLKKAHLYSWRPVEYSDQWETQGGKQGWHKGPDDSARQMSLQVYNTHRIRSTECDLEQLSNYLTAHEVLPSHLPYLHRIIPFTSHMDGKDLAKGLLSTLENAYGVSRCPDTKRVAAIPSSPVLPNKLRRALQADGTIDFARLFHDRTLPLKWEICSGNGDWAVAQAKADHHSANWAAFELRYDRSHAGVCQATMQETRNICFVVGDAAAVFARHVIPGTVQHIFVMHPEPPQQLGGVAELKSEAQHLLAPAFVLSVCKALQGNGCLLVVTDSQWYGRLLLEEFAMLCEGDHGLRPFQPKEPSRYRVIERKSGLQLFAGQPGSDCGIPNPSASSYFHQLKEQEKASRQFHDHTTRYFLGLIKVNS